MSDLDNVNLDQIDPYFELVEQLKEDFDAWYNILSDHELEANQVLSRVIARVDRLFTQVSQSV